MSDYFLSLDMILARSLPADAPIYTWLRMRILVVAIANEENQ